ncbi:hypothetical protein [Nitrosopumilus ureiphilus]|uniref:hypothetical protein n=1 Tax=Nitrosopumilus ureiphilus TaxID=1470067 RepID=UPI0015C7C0E4|nr:hypothetical protein [Nitrosopumilus ureiphilus]
MQTRTDKFGLLAIVIGIVSSVWIFGFADDVFSVFQAGSDEISDVLFYENFLEQRESSIAENVLQENILLPPSQPVLSEPTPSNSKKKPESIQSVPEESIIQHVENEIKQVEPKMSLEKKIMQLEKQTFILSGDGSGYEGAVHLSEHARLNFELNPVSGTKLDEFNIKSGTLIVGGHTFVIGGGSVILDQGIISISIEHDDHRDPYLDMTGTVQGSIINDEDLAISFENQLLGLTKEDQTPIHLSLELTMKIKD